ncbi:MAG: hypothetical protein F6K14_15695 [Symploca sp. SIO2C1]|nr:hypothetical protein [Symploca sp. SIO2C1]
MKQNIEAIRKQHEKWLKQLETLAVQAIATGEWDDFFFHIMDFTGWSRIDTY